MDNNRLTRQLRRINSLIQRARQTSFQDIELQAHWGRYLCVLVAGFLENALTEIYTDFAKRAASEPVASFAGSALARIQNPNAERFLQTARAFKSSWADELEQFLGEEGCKEAIDSIIANRNQIAHGQDSGITIVRVSDYLEKCVQVIEFLEAQCKGGSTQ